jgi:hemolysin III
LSQKRRWLVVTPKIVLSRYTAFHSNRFGGTVGTVNEERPAAPPLLRGWFHTAAFAISVPAGLLLVLAAGGARARIATAVYATGVMALFGVSAAYHRGRWSDAARTRMRRLDHGTIFFMIAGTYTPIALLALTGGTATAMLIAAWIGAGIGMVFAATGIAEKKVFGLLSYIGLGWMAVFVMPELARRFGGGTLSLLIVGGGLYTIGAVILGVRWPDPSPRFFGYHEIWHALVIAACVCHFIVVASVVGRV